MHLAQANGVAQLQALHVHCMYAACTLHAHTACTHCIYTLQADGVVQLDAAVQRGRRTQLALQDAAQLVSLLNEHSAASNRYNPHPSNYPSPWP